MCSENEGLWGPAEFQVQAIDQLDATNTEVCVAIKPVRMQIVGRTLKSLKASGRKQK